MANHVLFVRHGDEEVMLADDVDDILIEDDWAVEYDEVWEQDIPAWLIVCVAVTPSVGDATVGKTAVTPPGRLTACTEMYSDFASAPQISAPIPISILGHIFSSVVNVETHRNWPAVPPKYTPSSVARISPGPSAAPIVNPMPPAMSWPVAARAVP
jgi:hypothetical protein